MISTRTEVIISQLGNHQNLQVMLTDLLLVWESGKTGDGWFATETLLSFTTRNHSKSSNKISTYFEFLLQYSRSQGGSVFPLSHTGDAVRLKYTLNHTSLFLYTIFNSCCSDHFKTGKSAENACYVD